MAQGIPQLEKVPTMFRKSGEGAIASYNYTDLAEGTGVVKYYLAETKDYNNNISYLLTSNVIYSEDIETIIGNINTNPAMTFKLPAFNMPHSIRGTVYANLSYDNTTPAGVTASGSAYFQIQKLSNGTTTTIATSNATMWSNTNAQSLVTHVFTPQVTVPLTHFKKGDQLYFVWNMSGSTSSGTGTARYAHDPAGRAATHMSGSVPTSSTVFIPYAINL